MTENEIPQNLTSRVETKLRLLRISIYVLTSLYFVNRSFIVNFSYGKVTTRVSDSLGYVVGWKTSEVFDYSGNWGKFSYVLAVLFGYLLIATCVCVALPERKTASLVKVEHDLVDDSEGRTFRRS